MIIYSFVSASLTKFAMRWTWAEVICVTTETGKLNESKLEEMKFKDRKKLRKEKENGNFEVSAELKSLWEEMRKYVLYHIVNKSATH